MEAALHGVRFQKLVSDVSSTEISDQTKFFMSSVIRLQFFHHFRDWTSTVFYDFLRSDFTFHFSTMITSLFSLFLRSDMSSLLDQTSFIVRSQIEEVQSQKQ